MTDSPPPEIDISDEVPCPRCGSPVDPRCADAIAEDMEVKGRSCIGCGKTFGDTYEDDA